ncbi:MAG: SMI1/KNR4 family protein [Salibacteraceae bacterium]
MSSAHRIQLLRIKDKLSMARLADPSKRIFGADSHCYQLRSRASEVEICAFETKYKVQLPSGFRAFLLKVGNGGAGPDYGIYPLGKGMSQLFGEDPVSFLNQPCILTPALTNEEWEAMSMVRNDEDVSDEVYVEESGKLFGGILILGTQGCTYYNGLVLTGPHQGRVIFLDGAWQKPYFAEEDCFLNWYESWLGKVISGKLKKY